MSKQKQNKFWPWGLLSLLNRLASQKLRPSPSLSITTPPSPPSLLNRAFTSTCRRRHFYYQASPECMWKHILHYRSDTNAISLSLKVPLIHWVRHWLTLICISVHISVYMGTWHFINILLIICDNSQVFKKDNLAVCFQNLPSKWTLLWWKHTSILPEWSHSVGLCWSYDYWFYCSRAGSTV